MQIVTYVTRFEWVCYFLTLSVRRVGNSRG
jgi:hypothetical protein